MPTAPPTIPEIRVLPALVANQIAAGEVVERPASVVKELIDNAIDAGASRITVELEQGGVELVRVTDDGHGVPPAQLALMVAPHATSKVRSADDLDRVTTMGFRGEALASIASVSRLSIRSRTALDVGASRLDCEGVDLSAVRPEAGSVGTSITVRNLFFNTPARRKFLKTPATEQGHATDAVRDLAMSHPHVGFTLKIDGRQTLDLAAGQSPRERAMALLGTELESQYLECSADTFDDSRGVALWGLVGLPAIARPSPRWQHVFVNGRPIRDKTIQHALKEAYRGLIEPGKHPSAVLQLVMDPGAVDVNVHPAKAEVRFRDSSLIHQVVYRAVRDALRGADLTPAVGGAGGGVSMPGAPSLPLTPIGVSGFGGGGSGMGEGARTGGATAAAFVDYFSRRVPAATGGKFEFDGVRRAVDSDRSRDGADFVSSGFAGGAEMHGPGADSRAATPGMLAAPIPAERVLQVHNSYLVTQDEQGVVIIDQHALHERVMYEKLRARTATGPLESQRMLVPAAVGASAMAMERLPQYAAFLETLGIALEPSGSASVLVQAFPSFLLEKGVDAGVFVSELLEKIESEPTASKDQDGARREALLHEVLDMMACKAAVKAGDALSSSELEELLRLREVVERSSNCPHGRPTAIRVSIRDLERSFGRA
jgi:DNA mismatch repair protein MutL